MAEEKEATQAASLEKKATPEAKPPTAATDSTDAEKVTFPELNNTLFEVDEDLHSAKNFPQKVSAHHGDIFLCLANCLISVAACVEFSTDSTQVQFVWQSRGQLSIALLVPFFLFLTNPSFFCRSHYY